MTSLPSSVLAGLSPGLFDLAALGLLLLFGLWGWWRGAPGQALSLLLLVLALVAARWLGPRVEEPLSQAVALAPAALPAAAWALAAVGVLLAAGVLVHAVAGMLPPRPPTSPRSRWLGGALGATKGLLLLVLLAYGALYAFPEAEARAIGAGSRAAGLLPPLRRLLAGASLLPAATDRVVSVVEERLEGRP